MSKIANVVLVAAGSFIAGILLAPKSGKETRKDLMKKTNEYKDKASDGLREIKKGAGSVKGELNEGAQSVRNIATDAVGDAKRTANRIKNESSQRAESVRQDVQETAERTKRQRDTKQ